jgi:hypothetical protein
MAESSSRQEPLPMRWAVILMAALFVGLVVGLLTFLQADAWPSAVLAGLAGAGMTITAMHRILGR